MQKEFFDSSESDGDAEMMMIMSIQEEMDRELGRILNFKGMIKGRRVFNRNRVDGGRLLYKDYFKPGPIVPDNFFVDAFVCANPCSCAWWREWRHMICTSGSTGIVADNSRSLLSRNARLL